MTNNDLISRAAAIDAIVSITSFLDVDSIKSIYNIGNGEEWVDGVYDAINAVEDVNAVDAAPVIRCKDCRYYNTNYCGDGFGWCERKGIGHGTSDDWFCADGERADAPTCGPDYCEIGGGDDE